jgi:hypothetical protein
MFLFAEIDVRFNRVGLNLFIKPNWHYVLFDIAIRY